MWNIFSGLVRICPSCNFLWNSCFFFKFPVSPRTPCTFFALNGRPETRPSNWQQWVSLGTKSIWEFVLGLEICVSFGTVALAYRKITGKCIACNDKCSTQFSLSSPCDQVQLRNHIRCSPTSLHWKCPAQVNSESKDLHWCPGLLNMHFQNTMRNQSIEISTSILLMEIKSLEANVNGFNVWILLMFLPTPVFALNNYQHPSKSLFYQQQHSGSALFATYLAYLSYLSLELFWLCHFHDDHFTQQTSKFSRQRHGWTTTLPGERIVQRLHKQFSFHDRWLSTHFPFF